MITPRFQVKQTETDLIFTIHAPYASIADAEIYADLDIFCFYASPYYLRIHLSGHIEETDASKGSYDAETGTFTICVQKVKHGEHFENLDFITALLTPSQNEKQNLAKPLIEVLDDVDSVDIDEENSDNGDEWYIDQCPFEEPSEEFLLTAPHYGFANKVSGAFQNFQSEFRDIIELPDPDKTQSFHRTRLRTAQEAEDFSDDHYLADWAQPELIDPLLTFKARWETDSKVSFTSEEVDILKDLPKREFLLDKNEKQVVCLSLIDILFAYAYNVRSTMGENTVESAWTVNKISGTLSWLQTYSNLKEAVLVPFRRSLCYPLYRHWGLSEKVLKDVQCFLKLGRQQILKCLLEVYSMFNSSEPRYMLNQLYIRDYCIWIQHVSDSHIKSLSAALEKVNICKNDVNLDLNELETAANLVQMEMEARNDKPKDRKATPEDSLCKVIASLSVSEKRNDNDDTSDSEDDSSSSSSTSCSTSSSSDLDSDDLSDGDQKGKSC